MIYIINIIKYESGKVIYYRAFDTYSESSMMLDATRLRRIILNTEINVVNARVINDQIVISDWGKELHTELRSTSGGQIVDEHSGAKFTLLSRGHQGYRLLHYTGSVYYPVDLGCIIDVNDISNYNTPANNKVPQVEAIGMYEISKDEAFEKLIETKYIKFIAKATLLGYGNIAFEYAIEHHMVRITKYTGSSKSIILPNFVSAIGIGAFRDTHIEALSLNEGLKSIGPGAFEDGELTRVEIPESVELICPGAFRHNSRLFNNKGFINMDRVQLRNTKTIVMDQ